MLHPQDDGIEWLGHRDTLRHSQTDAYQIPRPPDTLLLQQPLGKELVVEGVGV